MSLQNAILSPRIDAVFKRLMGGANDADRIPQGFLDLPQQEYARVHLLDPHVTGEAPDDKLGILDVRLETATGKQIDIEISFPPCPKCPNASCST